MVFHKQAWLTGFFCVGDQLRMWIKR